MSIKLIDMLQEKDTFVVIKLGCFAQSKQDVLKILKFIKQEYYSPHLNMEIFEIN